MRPFRVLLLTGVLMCILSAQNAVHADGLALPWPFPWAKECAVDWQSMQGRYRLSDSIASERIDIQITPIGEHPLKYVRVTHYAQGGTLIASGSAYVLNQQRSLTLSLFPVEGHYGPSLRAQIKLFYAGNQKLCTKGNLVPILSLCRSETDPEQSSHYELVKVDDDCTEKYAFSF
jgi:hypothetical protein